MKQGAILVAILVLVHHIVAFVHGDAHSDLAIILSIFQQSVIYIIITAVPVIGVVLLWTPYRIIGLYSIIFWNGCWASIWYLLSLPVRITRSYLAPSKWPCTVACNFHLDCWCTRYLRRNLCHSY